jgi:hypothetical protein
MAWWAYLDWKGNKYGTKSRKSNYLHVGFGSILGGSIAIHVPEDASVALVPALSFSEFGEEVAQSKPSVIELDMNKNQDTVCSNCKSMSRKGQDGIWGLESFRFILIISGTQQQTCAFQPCFGERHLSLLERLKEG